MCVCSFVSLGHLPQSSHILLCFAAGELSGFMRGAVWSCREWGEVVLVAVLHVGRRAGLIHGSALSLEPGPWLSLPEVAAGGWQCAVIPDSVLVLCL